MKDPEKIERSEKPRSRRFIVSFPDRLPMEEGRLRLATWVAAAVVLGAAFGVLLTPERSAAALDAGDEGPELEGLSGLAAVSEAAGREDMVLLYNATHAPPLTSTHDARHGFLVPAGTRELRFVVQLNGGAAGASAVGLEDPQGRTVTTCQSCAQTVRDPAAGAWRVVYPAVSGYNAQVRVEGLGVDTLVGPLARLQRAQPATDPATAVEDAFYVPESHTHIRVGVSSQGATLPAGGGSVTIADPSGRVSRTLSPGDSFDNTDASEGLWTVRYSSTQQGTFLVAAELMGV